ncbi:MAG TPA: sugar ABC transporter substrate-binding protein [Pararhizobium sp.]|nr:sugar ABC transporter substrate-binding protein [Pararhizobium sp.]
MTNGSDGKGNGITIGRRTLLKTTAAGVVALAAPAVLTGRAEAATGTPDLSSVKGAKIDWGQAKGASITVGVIPAGYFDNLGAVLPEFKKLTGINIRLEKTPPGEIRQKAVLDLSSKTGTWASHAADPMYYPLYVKNKWIDPLDTYLANDKLTDDSWFDYGDILKSWSGSTSIDGKPYGIPYDGETTLQIYRTDVYKKLGLKPADTLDEYTSNAEKANDPSNRLWGCALRGFKGAGQNMYIYPSLFEEFGGKWFDPDHHIVVNSKEALDALEWYINLLTKYAPNGVQNWNWPDIADAFSQGTVASYIDANTSAAVVANPDKSKVVGKIGFARWPKGPSGRRVASIWNWSFPINAALGEKEKAATWLFIQWAASKEVQAATSFGFPGAYKRLGVNRTSVLSSDSYKELANKIGDTFLDATMASLQHDTDVEWRPRVPQWPAIGEIMATAIQSSLVGQAKPKEALDQAQKKISGIMRG